MESIEALLDKYWNGETTLEEEQLVRDHYAHVNSGNESTGTQGVTKDQQQAVLEAYFGEINRRKQMHYKGSSPGFRVTFRKQWLSLAATVVIGIVAGVMTIQQNQNRDPFLVEDPEKAMEIVKSTFSMISDNLNEGKKHASKIDKINRTKQILRTNQQD